MRYYREVKENDKEKHQKRQSILGNSDSLRDSNTECCNLKEIEKKLEGKSNE